MDSRPRDAQDWPARTGVPVADDPFRVVLHGALLPAGIVGLVATLVLWIVRGTDGGVSALGGVVVALAFFASGLVMMSRFVKSADPMTFMAVGLATYFGQVIVLFGVLVLARQIDSLDAVAAGIAMLVVILVWQVAQVVAWRRARVPVYDEPTSDQGETA